MFRRKNNLLIVAVCLVAVLVVGVIATMLMKRLDSMETSVKYVKSNYAIGNISTSTGKVVESKQNIYTKDMNKIEDATIKLSEDATISYKVFFYDKDKVFLEATEALDEDFDAEDIAEGAVYFRVVITPGLVDGEAVELTSGSDIARYISQISIVVAK